MGQRGGGREVAQGGGCVGGAALPWMGVPLAEFCSKQLLQVHQPNETGTGLPLLPVGPPVPDADLILDFFLFGHRFAPVPRLRFPLPKGNVSAAPAFPRARGVPPTRGTSPRGGRCLTPSTRMALARLAFNSARGGELGRVAHPWVPYHDWSRVLVRFGK